MLVFENCVVFESQVHGVKRECKRAARTVEREEELKWRRRKVARAVTVDVNPGRFW